MSDSPSPTPANSIDPSAAFVAFSHPARWAALKLMAAGQSVTVGDVARFAPTVDMMRKHLRVLRAAGVVQSVLNPADTRMPSYFIPEQFRPQPGVVDYGFCQLRFS